MPSQSRLYVEYAYAWLMVDTIFSFKNIMTVTPCVDFCAAGTTIDEGALLLDGRQALFSGTNLLIHRTN